MMAAPRPKKVYDCFIFYDEIDLLTIRLHELYDHVDYFVICEATSTFQGKRKALTFAENRETFAAFENKIIHLVVDDMPAGEPPLEREKHQRNAIRRALVDLAPDDVVIVSDVDEIIRPSIIENLRSHEGYFLLKMERYEFYLNMYAGTWIKPFAYSWALDREVGPYHDARIHEGETLKRFPGRGHLIEDAGWHFVFVGGADAVRSKLSAYTPAEPWLHGQMLRSGVVEQQLSILRKFGGETLLQFRPIDATFPKYVQDNQLALTEVGLIKDSVDRMRELEKEFANLEWERKRSDGQHRYKDFELRRLRTAKFAFNLALNKPCLQSSVSIWSHSQIADFDAGHAVDGVIREAGKFAFHTDYEENPWWQVDLQAECDVQEVVIYNRQDYSKRLQHFSLLKSFDGQSWEVCFRKSDDTYFTESYTARLPPGTRMRFLRVRLDGRDFLHFNQCFVYGESVPVASTAEAPRVAGPAIAAPSGEKGAVATPVIAKRSEGDLAANEAHDPVGREAVRLVVWDLDDTFWHGTVTEGGLKEYVQANHDIVIELAKRGIISSICSKNNEDQIREILRDKGILDYFVFPSISWNPKGPRLQALIDDVQLRAPTVMFIDDNPSNRAEAADMVPGLQVVDETFIPKILADPRFVGKNDSKLTRLAQYKLLESRKDDEKKTAGSNEDFLRSCDVRVQIEHDVLKHIDRAIELINRTNQLNFTKLRLPEDLGEARARLETLVRGRETQAGLVRVIDKYGDYGFVGFFLTENQYFDAAGGKVFKKATHFCFSCRTLGMLVEQWLYEWLGRPAIEVMGEVLTDLTVPRVIDWVRLVPSGADDAPAVAKVVPEIRIHGGCETASIVHYLSPYADNVSVAGNFFAGSSFIRVNGASLLLSACDRVGPEFKREAAALGVPYKTLVSEYFANAPEGTAFVFGGQLDAYDSIRYRHKIHGWEMRIEPFGFETFDLTLMPQEEYARRLAAMDEGPEKSAEIAAITSHIREHYGHVDPPDDARVAQTMHALIARVPVGSKLIVLLDDPRVRGNSGVKSWDFIRKYNENIRQIVAEYPFVAIASFADWIYDEEEIQLGGNHYDRMVYLRIAEAMIAALKEIPAKAA